MTDTQALWVNFRTKSVHIWRFFTCQNLSCRVQKRMLETCIANLGPTFAGYGPNIGPDLLELGQPSAKLGQHQAGSGPNVAKLGQPSQNIGRAVKPPWSARARLGGGKRGALAMYIAALIDPCMQPSSYPPLSASLPGFRASVPVHSHSFASLAGIQRCAPASRPPGMPAQSQKSGKAWADRRKWTEFGRRGTKFGRRTSPKLGNEHVDRSAKGAWAASRRQIGGTWTSPDRNDCISSA